MPVLVEHDADDSQQGEDAGNDAQQSGCDKTLNAVDVAGHPADEISGSFFIVFGKRKSVDVVIERAPEVMHHPLPDISSEIVHHVGTDCTHNGNECNRTDGKVEDGHIAASDPAND